MDPFFLKWKQINATPIFKNFPKSNFILITTEMKLHTIEDSPKQMYKRLAQNMEINIIPLSDNTIAKRITDWSEDIEDNVKNMPRLMHCTVIGLMNLVIIMKQQTFCLHVCLLHSWKKDSRIVFMVQILGITHDENIFNNFNDYMKSGNCLWENCIVICTEEISFMIVKMNTLHVAHVK